MRIRFAPLLRLELNHEFYGGARSRDFRFIIPSLSARVLAGGRLVAKERDGALAVYYEATAGGPALVPIAGKALQFGLKLVDPLFCNYTALPLLAAGGLPLYRNAADKRKLDAPVPLFLNQADEEDAELMRLRLFALVEIRLDATFYDDAPQFEIRFGARTEQLRYYVVARKYSQAEFNALVVNDTRPAADPDHIAFQRVGASEFTGTELDADLLRGADGRVALFHSLGDVARRAASRNGIALELGGTALIPDLPQPGRAAASGNVIVHLSKP